MVTIANGPRALEKKLMAYGINLKRYFEDAEKDLGVAPLPQRLVGKRTRMLLKASEECGYESEPMPKFIDYTRCKSCGRCADGCLHAAKWTAEEFVKEAQKNGAEILPGVSAERILHSNDEVKGVSARKESRVSEIKAEIVIVAAGGLGTPIILQKSGFDEAGTNLTAGLNIVTWGLMKDPVKRNEISMAATIKVGQGVIISPFFLGERSKWQNFLLRTPINYNLAKLPLGRFKTIGMITKIPDESVGKVLADGSINKPITQRDRENLDKGIQISRDILAQAGAKSDSIKVTNVQGSHPGGTARIGRVVNKNHETVVNRLFVCDASVFPECPGKPPLLTIVALAKRFAELLVSEYL